MIKNYFTIAFRTVWKNKMFTAINILGLAIGISASLVICLLVNHHFSFDKWGRDGRFFRVVSDFEFSGERYHNSGVPDPMGAAVRREITGLDEVVSFRTWNGGTKVTVPQINTGIQVTFKKQQDIVFADSNYFNMVTYKWLAGSPRTSLVEPYQTVITELNARLYFPGLDASGVVGKQIYFDDTVAATITGVVKDLSGNSDFNFKTFVSYSTLEKTSLKPENWDQWGSTYGSQQLWVKLLPGTTTIQVENQIQELYRKRNKREPGDNGKTWYSLQSLNELHFNADYGTYGVPQAHKPTLYGLLAVALFLLALGCINFINLATANAANRAKEIGIRKTMGSSRRQLMLQFLAEAFLLSFSATLFSTVLTPLVLHAFAGFIPGELRFNVIEQPGILIFLVALLVVVTLFSGFYPAIILSRFKPVLILKNQLYADTSASRSTWLRKTLTISQFVIAQVFIMSAILVSKQINYSLTRDLGFKKEAILYMNTNFYDTVRSHKYALMDKLRNIPGIDMVSLSTNPPSTWNTWSGTMKFKDGKKEIETDVQHKFGDTNFIKLYRLKLLAGNNIPQTDTVTSFIINETYARLLGFNQPWQAIGKHLIWNDKQVPILGVIATSTRSPCMSRSNHLRSEGGNQRNVL